MSEALVCSGHDVIWWTSNFSHHFKKHRSSGWTDIQVKDCFKIRLVPTPGYKTNVSVRRIIRDAVFSYRTYLRGKELSAPDCIVYYESPLSFGYAGQKLAQFHGCPVVYDQMDLWPELIAQIFPQSVRPLAQFLFKPVYKSRRKIYERLDAAIGLAQPYLDVMLRDAPVLRSRPHEVIYNGVDVEAFHRIMKDTAVPESLRVLKEDGEVWAVFAGSLGPSYDIFTLLEVAEKIRSSKSKLRLVIAGDGPLRSQVEKFSEKKYARLHYAGQLAPEKLIALYKGCDIGLCAYSAKSNVEMPDKIYDYTAAGLPVVNSLTGEVAKVINEKALGLQYRPGDSNDLLDKLERLVKDEPLRAQMAKNSFEVGMTYDRYIQYGKLVDMIEKVHMEDQERSRNQSRRASVA
jgi:glycosyltransferase involved in cell wall biosynthesis